MSEIGQRQESILLLDLGTCTTKAVLLDVVEGQYGLVATAQAPSTARDPWQNLSYGAVEAISRLEEICGRTLLGEAEPDGADGATPTERHGASGRLGPIDRRLITPEDEDGRGVDRLLVVSSAGEPLRVLLVGGMHDLSLASARRALHSTYARLQGEISFDALPAGQRVASQRVAAQRAAGRRPSAGSKMDTVLKADADLVLLVGGTEGGASELIVEMAREALYTALKLMGENGPRVLYAGNQALVQEITQLFEDVAQVEVTDNVRPMVEVEDVAPAAQALNSIFYELKMRTLPGLPTIREWSRTLVLPTVRATETAIRCCAQVYETSKPALGVDLGSASVALHIAQDHQVRTAVRTDLGMGKNLLALLDQVQPDEITRWLPFELEPEAFLDWFYHKAHHPQTIPQTRRDLLLELAAARELVRLALADLLPAWEAERGLLGRAEFTGRRSLPPRRLVPPCDPIVGSGSLLSRAPHPGLAALVLLDALQPLGVSALYQDENGLLPAVGSVAKVEPLAAVQILRGEGLLPLGTVVAPLGRARSGARALTVRSLDPDVEVDQVVRYGELCVFSPSLLEGSTEPPLLELVPARGFDLGRGAGKGIQITYRPGACGLIVDARGRPLELGPAGDARREQMAEWTFKMTGERGV